MPSPTDFARRSNRDGTTDSICTRCYDTVATATWEADLVSAERSHECKSRKVEQFMKSVRKSDQVGRPASGAS
jgi:hypothetical protein